MSWKLKIAYWMLVAATVAGATIMLSVYTPEEVTMGQIQKIFYVHLPSAINAFLACAISFVAAIGYLWKRRMAWDSLSAAAATVAAGMCTVVLLTGVIWGHAAWGKWWAWTPRLTFSLLLWLLYVVYLIIRPSIESPQRRATICAVYAIAAFLDVPLVYLSVRLMPDIHPTSIELAPAMKITLAVWFVPVTLVTMGLVMAIFQRNQRRLKRDLAEPDEVPWAIPAPAAGGDADEPAEAHAGEKT